jgi:hypothetical protein
MDQISITPVQMLALCDALAKRDMIPKDRVNYRRAEHCGNCVMFLENTETCTLVKGHIDSADVCDRWESKGAGKSAETPSLMATPDILGPEGLWHTPSKKVPVKQKLPNYIEHIADALMRAGHGEQEAIAFAVNAVKRWARGELGWGKKKVTPQVQAAAQKTLDEWNRLKASHEG